MSGRSDADVIRDTHNVARFFTERRAIAWVALVGVVTWGTYGYAHMPKRKDPHIPIRLAVASTPWPGVSAEKVEHLVTRAVEERIAGNTRVHPPTASEFGIKSLSLPGLSIVQVQLADDVSDLRRELSDIALRLNDLNRSLPEGAGPIQFDSDFGETAAMMLTVASPPANPLEVALRAEGVKRALTATRAGTGAQENRAALVAIFPDGVSANIPQRIRNLVAQHLVASGIARDVRVFQGPDFVGLDADVSVDDAALGAAVLAYMRDRLALRRFHPDAWGPVIIRNPDETERRLAAAAVPRYTYRQLDAFTDLIQRTLQAAPQVSVVQRWGVLDEQIYLEYSQARLAAYGIQPTSIRRILGTRNIALPGGVISSGGTDVFLDPSGELTRPSQLGGVIVTMDSKGNAVYLRDLVEIARSYPNPPGFLNYYTWRDPQGRWQRSAAVTLAVQMRTGEQIAQFGQAVDGALAAVRAQLPPDLVIARTSDQPRQVQENIDLFMSALYEAIILVVLAALVGFWEWRSAVLMALSIPIILAMTFGMMFALGIELQQVSIGALIISLGLLVDDPVVAGDAIKRELAAGHPRMVAAWLGPTKLARAILFATVTNIVAYLPFLLLQGTTGEFLKSLPIVMTCALVASRVASMTFVPLLGFYLLRAPRRPARPIEELRSRGVTGLYYRVGIAALEHRWLSCGVAVLVLAVGVVAAVRLPSSFFPEDLQYLSYVNVWLPNNSSIDRTDEVATRAIAVVQRAAEEYGREHPGRDGTPRTILKSVTSFVGGGGPRFWYSISPEHRQKNYAQLILEVENKADTPALVARLRLVLAAALDGARVDVHQLETNPVGFPIQVQFSGGADMDAEGSQTEIAALRRLAHQATDIIAATGLAAGLRDDWGEESLVVKLDVDADRANLAGISNLDVAGSAGAGINGYYVTTLREGDRQIPVVARLRLEERARLADVENLYVYAQQGMEKVPLRAVASTHHAMETQRIRRDDHFRAITVLGFPAPGAYTSEVMAAVRPRLAALAADLPPGYRMTIRGSEARQEDGFRQLALIMAMSAVGIFVALVVEFNHLAKPLLVFAAVPFGIVGALVALDLMGEPFGFMAFLGIASLIGVIVSHVIVLFDFIEENHARGEPLVESLLDAGIARLRPIAITVGATMLAFVPLAISGGPLWRPLCYAQIGGLALATFIELLLVKVFYAIFVRDLKLVKWETPPPASSTQAAPARIDAAQGDSP